MSRTRILAALVMISALLAAGCLTTSDPAGDPSDDPAGPTQKRFHVLANAAEPADLVAPVFDTLVSVAKGGPVYGAGEPSIWAHTDGTLWLAFPGCDTGFYLVRVAGQPTCDHGPVYRSDDDGVTWQRLNDAQTGRLADEGPAANGDNDVTVDAAGSVYASNLGGGIQVLASHDGGASWSHVGDVVPEEHWADRQWMAASAPGHLVMTWMGGAEGSQRAVAVNTTFDAGGSWTGVEYFGEQIGWLGSVHFAPNGTAAYIPFTERAGGGVDLILAGAEEFTMKVIRTFDGGVTWDVVDTGVRIVSTATGGHWSGVMMAPALDVTGDGTIVVAWSEETHGPGGATATGSAVRVVTSADAGATWSKPRTVSDAANAIMPWVTGGGGDRYALTYFASIAPLDSDYVGGMWDVVAVVVDGEDVVRTTIDTNVHQGGLCARGGACLLTGSDRALLDFFEADLTADGRLAVTYPADPLTGGKYIEIRTAVQSDGSPLALVR